MIVNQSVYEHAFGSERIARQLRFVIDGIPLPLARPRFSKNGHVFNSQKSEQLIIGLSLAQQLAGRPLFKGPLKMDMTFYFPLPKRLSKIRQAVLLLAHHSQRPDTDNLIKQYCDCAGNNILFKDDAIVAEINARKLYSHNPRTEIIISELL